MAQSDKNKPSKIGKKSKRKLVFPTDYHANMRRLRAAEVLLQRVSEFDPPIEHVETGLEVDIQNFLKGILPPTDEEKADG